MTLDEAIKHAEEVAEEQEALYGLCPASESEIFHCDGIKDCKTLKNGKNKGCQKCAEEHRQLAAWLKDYKRLLEREHCDDAISLETVIEWLMAKDIILSSQEEIVRKELKQLPSVKQEQKTGYWTERKMQENGFFLPTCSECGEVEPATRHTFVFRYCPNCGARMVEANRESEDKECR